MGVTPFFSGLGMALLVSAPPGVNAALCFSLAREGAWGAVPVIVGAAAVDSCYAVLGLGGVLATGALGAGPTHWMESVFLALAAILLWPRAEGSAPAGTVPFAAVGAVVLNPATAALWLGLAPLARLGSEGPLASELWVLGIAIGTATWFSALALVAAKLHRAMAPPLQRQVRCAFAALLAGAALLVLL